MQETEATMNHIAPLEQGAGRAVAHPIDLLVDLGLLVDIGVGARNIGLRLIVIIITDEIFHRIVRKKRLELAVELRRQSLIMGENQGRPLTPLDDMRHGEGLARTRDPEQHLIPLVTLEPTQQLVDRRRLIPRRGIVRNNLERMKHLALRQVSGARTTQRIVVIWYLHRGTIHQSLNNFESLLTPVLLFVESKKMRDPFNIILEFLLSIKPINSTVKNLMGFE